MPSYAKKPAEIDIMRECGKRLRAVTDQLIPSITSGQTALSIDAHATTLLREAGIEGSFKTVDGYRWNTCIAINEQAVHTIPSSRILKPGDVVTVDIGGLYQGYHTDWATTIIVDHVADPRKEAFLAAGKKALEETIAILRVGAPLSIVGQTMERCIHGAGYQVLRDLTGHGIGKNLHEDPYIPNFVSHKKGKEYLIEPDFVAAIEIIYSESTTDIIQKNPDKWSLDTADGSLAACFEHTVHITPNGVDIFT
ncbi:MAG: type I methionyl aminopeptidase [bacterium]